MGGPFQHKHNHSTESQVDGNLLVLLRFLYVRLMFILASVEQLQEQKNLKPGLNSAKNL